MSYPLNIAPWTSVVYKYFFDTNFKRGVSHLFEKSIAFLIVASVAAVLFENTPAIYVGNEIAFHWFDVLSIGIFSIEYILRLITANQNPDFERSRFPRLKYVLSFYGIVDLISIAPFYATYFIALDVEMLRLLRVLRLARMFKLSREFLPAWAEFQVSNQGRSVRAKVYAMLEPTGHSGRLHTFIDDFLVFWIALSIVCVIFETVESVHSLFAREFYFIDCIAFTIFTIEYVARVYAAPENPRFKRLSVPRLAQMRTGQAVIDLLAILPFLLERLLSTQIDLRFLRVFRLLRMLKLTRYTSAISTLSKVLVREWQVIFAALFVLILLIVFTASLGYLLEHEAQPEIFENIPLSFYWAVTTLSSIGYGDMVPVTPLGRAVTVVVALIGVGVFAIPAGLLASAFTDQLHMDREAFKKRLVSAYEDGVLTHDERELIAVEAERLHLSKDEVKQLTLEARSEFEAQAANEKPRVSGLVLDPVAHPELAPIQFKLLIRQLSLLTEATGAEALRSELLKINSESNSINLEILSLISQIEKDQFSNEL